MFCANVDKPLKPAPEQGGESGPKEGVMSRTIIQCHGFRGVFMKLYSGYVKGFSVASTLASAFFAIALACYSVVTLNIMPARSPPAPSLHHGGAT